MLARSQRLRSDRAVRGALRSGRRVRGTHLSAQISGRAQPARFAFVVSRKVSKLAVTRNLLRRRMREIVRDLKQPTGDIVIIAYPSAAHLTFSQLKQELSQILSPRPHARSPRPNH